MQTGSSQREAARGRFRRQPPSSREGSARGGGRQSPGSGTTRSARFSRRDVLVLGSSGLRIPRTEQEEQQSFPPAPLPQRGTPWPAPWLSRMCHLLSDSKGNYPDISFPLPVSLKSLDPHGSEDSKWLQFCPPDPVSPSSLPPRLNGFGTVPLNLEQQRRNLQGLGGSLPKGKKPMAVIERREIHPGNHSWRSYSDKDKESPERSA